MKKTLSEPDLGTLWLRRVRSGQRGVVPRGTPDEAAIGGPLFAERAWCLPDEEANVGIWKPCFVRALEHFPSV